MEATGDRLATAKNDMFSFFAQNFCEVARGDRAAGFSRTSSALARSISSGSNFSGKVYYVHALNCSLGLRGKLGHTLLFCGHSQRSELQLQAVWWLLPPPPDPA